MFVCKCLYVFFKQPDDTEVDKLKDETYLTAFEEYEKKYDINGYQPEAEADKKISVKAKDKDNEKSSGKKKDKDKKKDKKK